MPTNLDSPRIFALKPAGWRDQASERLLVTALRALLLGFSGELPAGARVCADRAGALWLQIDRPQDAAAPEVSPPATLADAGVLERALAALDAPVPSDRSDPLDHDPALADLPAVPASENCGPRPSLDLLHAFGRQLASMPELAGSIEAHLDAATPAWLMTPSSADWVIAFAAVPEGSEHPGGLRALLPLALLPADPQAALERLDRALLHNDIRLLGAALQLVVTPEADAILLQAPIAAAHWEPPGLRALLGQMLSAREALLPILGVGTEAGTCGAGLDGSLHLQMHGLRG